MAKHYHVMAGTVGCLPEGNELFTSRRAAEQYAASEARDYRDAGYVVTGSAANGYSIDPINYIQVESCSDRMCELLGDNTY